MNKYLIYLENHYLERFSVEANSEEHAKEIYYNGGCDLYLSDLKRTRFCTYSDIISVIKQTK